MLSHLAKGVIADVLNKLEQESRNSTVNIACLQQQLATVRSDLRDNNESVVKLLANTDNLRAMVAENTKAALSTSWKGSEGKSMLAQEHQAHCASSQGHGHMHQVRAVLCCSVLFISV
jgi:capsule polysaccharide export protein KpsE/RkpR